MKILWRTLLGSLFGALAGVLLVLIDLLFPVASCGCELISCFINGGDPVDFVCDVCNGEIGKNYDRVVMAISFAIFGAVIGAIVGLSSAISKAKKAAREKAEYERKMAIAEAERKAKEVAAEAERKAKEAAAEVMRKAQEAEMLYNHNMRNHQMVVDEFNQLLEFANDSKSILDYGGKNVHFVAHQKREVSETVIKNCKDSCVALDNIVDNILSDAEEVR